VTEAYRAILIKELEKKVLVLLIDIYYSKLSRNDHTSTCESWGEGELSSVVSL
jgi:hypothetical protein